MANVTLNSRIVTRNATAAQWTTANPILLKGELGLEVDTGKIKFGDGVKAWSALAYIAGSGESTTVNIEDVIGAGTAAKKDVGTAEGNIPVLGTGGKLAVDVLPAIAISEVYAVSSQAEMLALTAQTGDIAIRSDVNKSYVLSADDPAVVGNWLELLVPEDAVLSVNGKTGTVVLTTSDIAEGTNLYYTEARTTANFEENFAAKSVSDLQGGDTLIHTTDTLILDGGGA